MKNNFKVYLSIEVILTFLLGLIAIFLIDSIEVYYLVFILLSEYAIITLLSFLEMPIYKKKLGFTHYFNSLVLVTSIVLLALNYDDLEFIIDYSFWLFVLIFLHGLLKVLKLVVKVDVTKNGDNKSTLPVGIYSPQHQKASSRIVFIPSIIIISASGILAYFFGFSFYIFLLIILYLVILFFLALRLAKQENQKLMSYEYDFDEEKMRKYYDELFQNNLHPETRNFLYMILYVYEAFLDYEKAEEIYQKITKPQHANYLITYENIRLNRIEDEEEWEKEFFLLKNNNLYSKKNYQLILDNIYNRHLAVAKGQLNMPLDSLFPITNNKTKLERALNIYNRSQYYKAINDEENYKLYKEQFINEYSFLIELVKKI